MSKHKKTRAASRRDYNSSEAAFKNIETKIDSVFKNTKALLPQKRVIRKVVFLQFQNQQK